MGLRFEWDENKNNINIKKHGISFQQARTVFEDEYAIYLSDDNHSEDEERFIAIGESVAPTQLLVVCHCHRLGNIIRIISARKADKKEISYYLAGGV